jgi:3-oxoacyl-(acyl-carrier-protein) synthase
MAEACITGIGSISVFGPTKGLIHGTQPPLRVIQSWPTRALRKACLVEPFRPSDVVPGLKTRRLDRLSVWALVASSLALQDAQLDMSTIDRSRCGVVFGTGFGPTELTEAFCASVADYGCSKADAIVFPETLDNSAGCHVAKNYGFRGPNIALTCRGVSGETAIFQAASILENGEADIIITIAGDVLTPTLHEYFESTRVMASVCFDAGDKDCEFQNWNGFIPGEGLSAFIMEKSDRCLERCGRSYGRYRSGCFGSDLTAMPFSWGQRHEITTDLMRKALGTARIEDVGIIVAASNGSPALDSLEAESIREVFGSSRSVPVVFPKEHLGEFDGNALVRLARALSPSSLSFQPGTVSQRNASEPSIGNSQPLQGKLALLLGASTGGGRAALTFELF